MRFRGGESSITEASAIFVGMSTSIEFLGTGTSQGVPVVACPCGVCRSNDPRDRRLRSSVLIRHGGSNVVIDAGPDLRQQLLRSEVRALDGVLLTHEHMDHIAGIDELRALNFAQQRAMDVYGSTRTLDAVRRTFHYAFAEERYPGVPELVLKPVGAEPFMVADLRFQPIEVMHQTMPVLGFRLGRFAYITDAKTIPSAEREKLRGLDLLVLNALRHKSHPSHLNVQEALALVEDLAPKRTLFTHISHLLGLHAESRAFLPVGVELAYDGQVVELGL